jgi:hypothetical protein
MNKTWHKRHPMPRNATPGQRVRWHLAHAAACACREMPKSVQAAIRAERVRGRRDR